MKFRIPFLALVLSCTLGPALAADVQADQPPIVTSSSPESEASLYGESLTLPRQAAVCAERIADYMPRFQKFYDAWRTENAALIAAGNKFIHEQASKGGVDADAGMAKLAEADVERLRKTSTELLARHCQLMLESMAPPAIN